MDELRALSPMNTNYDPPRPWQCLTPADHTCTGKVVGAVGSYPVCEPGAAAEIADRIADRARVQAWMDSPEGRRTLANEFAVERSIEWR